MTSRKRLRIGHVDRGLDSACFQSVGECLAVDDSAPRRVHEQRATPHRRDKTFIDEMFSGGRQGQQDDDDICPGQKIWQLVSAGDTLSRVATDAEEPHPVRA